MAYSSYIFLVIYKICVILGPRIGVSPSGKATDSDSVIRWFESSHPSHEKAPVYRGHFYGWDG